MKKIQLLSLSIIVIFILGDSKESRAQFSLANESYRTSFMSASINKGASSFPSLTFARQGSNEKRFTTIDKILIVPLGIVIGSLCGFVIGAAIPTDYSADKIVNFIKGGLIGASLGPFYTFEIMSMSKGVKNPSHKWFFKAGGNSTIPNYEETIFKIGYSIGIGRQYHMTDKIGLRGEFSYSLRQFLLPSQKISYDYHFERVVKCYDIDFSVGYINTSVLLNFKLLSLRKLDFYISLGPSLSLAVRDDKKFDFIKAEDNQDNLYFSYIMDEPSPLFGYPALVYQIELQSEKLI